MARTIIQTDKAPAAIGPYSQAVVCDASRLIYTAGQIPIDPNTGVLIAGDIAAQTRQALLNLQAVVEAAGSSLAQVVKTTVFLKDMNDFAVMNGVYGDFFGDDPPARSAIEAARLPKDVLIEIECVAAGT